MDYEARDLRWACDKDHIGVVDITGNILNLFSSETSKLSETTQLELKAVMGLRVITELVIGYLSKIVMS